MGENNVTFFKRNEIKKNDDNKRIRVIIHNSVYDVTDFLNEHPGGEEVLLEQAGEDATESFEDVAHSLDARSLMKKYKIGELHENDRVKTQEKIMKDWADKKDEHGGENLKLGKSPCNTLSESPQSYSSWKSWMVPVTLAILATIIYRFYFHH